MITTTAYGAFPLCQAMSLVLYLNSHITSSEQPLGSQSHSYHMWVYRWDWRGPKAKQENIKEGSKHVRGRTQTWSVSLSLHNYVMRTLSPQMRQLRLQSPQSTMKPLRNYQSSHFIGISLPVKHRWKQARKQRSKWMERHAMFIDWKAHSKDVNSLQSNLQV